MQVPDQLLFAVRARVEHVPLLRKLELVSRDEFDVQQAVLLRTREKLEALEKTVAALEHKLNH